MKINIVKHENLNKGKETRIYSPISKGEFENQMGEIFGIQHYKLGRRKKKAVYVDLGANIGLTTIYFQKWAKHIYSVEPSIENFRALQSNTADFKNISCHNHAIYPIEGEQSLFKIDPGTTPQTFFPDKPQIYRELVKCLPIDKFFEENEIKHVDVMKIDIENSEYALFPDESFKRVAKKIDFIIGEAHFYAHGFPEIIPEILEPLGFKVKFLQFDQPNLIRTFKFTNPVDHKSSNYEAKFNTIFTAERK